MKKLIIKQIARYKKKFLYKRNASRIEYGKACNEGITIIYRISDAGYKKLKPDYINNENCLANAVSAFPTAEYNWLVIADNCCDQTLTMIQKYIPVDKIRSVSVGHGAGTFNLAYDFALGLPDDEVVYFLENDYLHTPDAAKILTEGFAIDTNGYFTLYDHPDKYYIKENSVLYFTENSHWKETSSTTMTLAARVKTLKKDEKVWRKWTTGTHPYDWQIFLELKYFQKRKCYSSIPACSTHGEVKWLSPLIDWEKVALQR